MHNILVNNKWELDYHIFWPTLVFLSRLKDRMDSSEKEADLKTGIVMILHTVIHIPRKETISLVFFFKYLLVFPLVLINMVCTAFC